jgi:hypothetical protein
MWPTDIVFLGRRDTKMAHVVNVASIVVVIVIVVIIVITKCDNFSLSLSSTLGEGPL